MKRNNNMYIDYRSSYKRRSHNRRGHHGGGLIGLLLVILLATGLGFTAYHLSKGNLGERPNLELPTPSPRATDGKTVTPGAESSTEGTPAPTPTTEPTVTPTAEPTIEGTPTPTPIPAWDDNYLIGFTDTRQKVEVKGAYTARSLRNSDTLSNWLELADSTELNAVVIDVKADNGKVTYQMNHSYLKSLGVCTSDFRDMKALLGTLKEHGIYTIARIVCFRDPYAININPDFVLYKKDGELYKDRDGLAWINPYHKDAWEYIVDISEQAVLDGFDEICFDYIRVSTYHVGEIDFGPEAEETSLCDIITAFTKYACNRLKPLGAFVSASVYGTTIRSSVDEELLGQNYMEMSRYLDYICPMVYPSHYANGTFGVSVPDAEPYKFLLKQMKYSVDRLSVLEQEQDTYADVRPWLQAFTASWVSGYIKYTGPVIREEVQAVYDAGYHGWMLWNSALNYPEGAFLKK